ncbi:hypothetical protein [Streptomyces malaysiense]|uniref:Uncharacterized protein n=1 Tax=Streptomyces malaysiense TaxID=1428626 RepID=A0A1J4Q724_9ACTN|nr:hypothetical protein [Streptomyces malaysiense]OIK28973.1 hypothetical protein VT52_002520 [Streptomyces malaysiense]
MPAYPPGERTVGREAISAPREKVPAGRPRFEPGPSPPAPVGDGIALTATPPKGGTGARAQAARRRPATSRPRPLDRPECVPPAR